MPDTLTLALSLWRRGLSIIPVPAPDARHNGKVPLIAWREYQTRLPTEAELREWFCASSNNVAIITGAVSNLVAIDADDPAAVHWCVRRLPYTPWQTKTARGFHLFYRHPGVLVHNRARIETGNGRLAIDVRGDGGYVIGPGSVHASGARYEFAGNWTRTDVPRFWPGWLVRPTPRTPPRPPASRPTGAVADRARRYLSAIPPPTIGAGSDRATLYAACRLVRGFGVSPVVAEQLIWEWAGNRPGWTHDWIAAKVRHAERYGTEPEGALR